ncbi:S-adenosylmethionine:tRNA ribosyltransferase-isomerase, partial [Persephonella sp.]
MYRLSDFDYHLPKELIAKYPVEPRDSCRLMVLDRKDGSIQHRIFRDIVDYLEEGDTLVLNDTKVIPARLKGKKKTGASI